MEKRGSFQNGALTEEKRGSFKNANFKLEEVSVR